MRKVVRIVLVLLVVAAAFGGYAFWRGMPKIPTRPFVAPAGSYPVGTRQFTWIDSSRAESYTRDPADVRKVAIQVWYPAAPGATGDTALYLLHREGYSSKLGAFAARKARTHSVLDAPVAVSDSGFPVLLYNHGGAWTRWSATFTTEWLASHGYVVFSVEHYGFNQSSSFPDGSPFVADTLAFPTPTGDGRADAEASWAYLDDPVFRIWLADARFALDRIEALNAGSGPFAGRLDLTRIGAFGWSFGGALAIQLSLDDPRVIAAVDHDGQLFGDVRDRGTSRPVLQLHHGIDDAAGYPEDQRDDVRDLMALVERWDSTARERSTADWYSITIAGTDHGDFSDLSLFFPRPEGRTAAARAHALINGYTLAFFDQYLKGRPSAMLAEGREAEPEVSFKAWRRQQGMPAADPR